jgi:hypothetical protein
MLPVVRQLLVEIQGGRERVAQRSARLDDLLARTGGNGHLAGQVDQARTEMEQAVTDLQRLIEELEELGVELKGIDDGLVDFRSLREGRIVYLCYRLDEETIAYWHELDTGFAGRQPLP